MPADEICLICDARERNVIERHAAEFATINMKTQQITTGDYAVTCGEKIITIIERKSLEDFAASFKDGRANNRQKLISLREKTGCKIIYLIEGKAYPKPDDKFGRIAYSNIESSIFHLMVRDNISVIWTKDTLHTAQTLVRFVKSMKSLVAKDIIDDTPVVVKQEEDIVVNGSEDLLTMKHEKSDEDILRSLWACFKGITVETADEFIPKFTLSDIISGKIPRDQIEKLKTPTGRKVSSLVVKSLTSALDKSTELRLLSVIPGISSTTASDILRGTKLSALLSYDVGAISIIKVGKSKKNLGEEKASRIKKYFEYKQQPVEVAPVLNNADIEIIDDFINDL
jgi:ERCC4-type nuclease